MKLPAILVKNHKNSFIKILYITRHSKIKKLINLEKEDKIYLVYNKTLHKLQLITKEEINFESIHRQNLEINIPHKSYYIFLRVYKKQLLRYFDSIDYSDDLKLYY